MLVTFRTNLGRIDAASLQIEDWAKCTKGAKVNISDKAAEILARRNIVEIHEQKGVPSGSDIRGVKADK